MTEEHPEQNPLDDDSHQTITPLPEDGETTTTPPLEERRPVRVEVRLPQRSPVVTYTIMGITILVFLLQMFSESWYGNDYPGDWLLKVNDAILSGEYWRLITPILVHGNIFHIGFNMYALYIIGPGLESFYGHGRFLLLYLISGFAGVVGSFVFTEADSLGASTAIFGLLAAQGVFAYQNQPVFGAQARRALRSILNVAVINLLLGLSPGIDNWGHVGGLIGGLIVSWFGGPVFRIAGTPPHLYLENTRRLDRFLAASALAVMVFMIVVMWVFRGGGV
jgi:rhomboid protease GluP